MSFPSAADLEGLVPSSDLPPLARVRYDPPQPVVEDRDAAVEYTLDQLIGGVDPGSTIAIGVGSRGIDRIDQLTAQVVDILENRGFDPYIVPAMGSHGGGTASGQRAVLEGLGITPSSVNCPIEASMETTTIGTADIVTTTVEVPFSTAALSADLVLPINRIAPHTSFNGRIESGIAKMLVVGFGKREGARLLHRLGRTYGFVDTIEAILPVVFDVVSTGGGMGIVENGDKRVADVTPIPRDGLLTIEAEVLRRARDLLPTYPFDTIDLLVVDTMGKDISGTGMDPNVIGRPGTGGSVPPGASSVERIYVRSLSPGSKGNANGIGLADIVNSDVYDAMDPQATYANVLTSGYPEKAAIPMVMPTDELAIHALVESLGARSRDDLRIAWIGHTGGLSRFRASEALLRRIDDPDIHIEEWLEVEFVEGELVGSAIS